MDRLKTKFQYDVERLCGVKELDRDHFRSTLKREPTAEATVDELREINKGRQKMVRMLRAN